VNKGPSPFAGVALGRWSSCSKCGSKAFMATRGNGFLWVCVETERCGLQTNVTDGAVVAPRRSVSAPMQETEAA